MIVAHAYSNRRGQSETSIDQSETGIDQSETTLDRFDSPPPRCYESYVGIHDCEAARHSASKFTWVLYKKRLLELQKDSLMLYLGLGQMKSNVFEYTRL